MSHGSVLNPQFKNEKLQLADWVKDSFDPGLSGPNSHHEPPALTALKNLKHAPTPGEKKLKDLEQKIDAGLAQQRAKKGRFIKIEHKIDHVIEDKLIRKNAENVDLD